ncbi:MAG: hypothetical protein ACHREM_00645 [Polyangiales bacterium]
MSTNETDTGKSPDDVKNKGEFEKALNKYLTSLGELFSPELRDHAGRFFRHNAVFADAFPSVGAATTPATEPWVAQPVTDEMTALLMEIGTEWTPMSTDAEADLAIACKRKGLLVGRTCTSLVGATHLEFALSQLGLLHLRTLEKTPASPGSLGLRPCAATPEDEHADAIAKKRCRDDLSTWLLQVVNAPSRRDNSRRLYLMDARAKEVDVASIDTGRHCRFDVPPGEVDVDKLVFEILGSAVVSLALSPMFARMLRLEIMPDVKNPRVHYEFSARV